MSDDYSYLFDLLSIPDDGSFILSDVCVEGPKKSVTLSRRAAPAFCPQCSSRMHSKGIYTRTGFSINGAALKPLKIQVVECHKKNNLNSRMRRNEKWQSNMTKNLRNR